MKAKAAGSPVGSTDELARLAADSKSLAARAARALGGGRCRGCRGHVSRSARRGAAPRRHAPRVQKSPKLATPITLVACHALGRALHTAQTDQSKCNQSTVCSAGVNMATVLCGLAATVVARFFALRIHLPASRHRAQVDESRACIACACTAANRRWWKSDRGLQARSVRASHDTWQFGATKSARRQVYFATPARAC